MTDNEIIKTLGCCIKDNEDCWDCPLQNKWDCHNALKNNALELINRQKTEIEEYKKANILIAQQRDGRDKDIAELEAAIETLETNNHSLCMTLANRARTERAEAIKEFAERLKEKSQRYPYYEYGLVRAVPTDEIDNLVKEMTSK